MTRFIVKSDQFYLRAELDLIWRPNTWTQSNSTSVLHAFFSEIILNSMHNRNKWLNLFVSNKWSLWKQTGTNTKFIPVLPILAVLVLLPIWLAFYPSLQEAHLHLVVLMVLKLYLRYTPITISKKKYFLAADWHISFCLTCVWNGVHFQSKLNYASHLG